MKRPASRALLVLPGWLVRWVGWGVSAAGAGLLPGVVLWALWAERPPVGPLRPEMMELPAGRFVMGSPEPEEGRRDDEAQREVTLTQPFALARTEVTQGMYRRVMGTNPSCEEYKGVSLLGDDLPVQCVTWFEAVTYCNALSGLEGLTPAYTIAGEQVEQVADADGYRLPTEAEWEYAARAATADVYAGTSDPGEVCRYGNVADVSGKGVFGFSETFSCDDGVAGLAPVARYQPNAWGFFDLTGNVWEWTWDWYDQKYSTSNDPQGPETGSYRVNRGGSWRSNPRGTRVAARDYASPGARDYYLGFRPARSLPSAL